MKAELKHTPGPWSRCSAREGKCSCGMVFSEKHDQNVFTAKNVIGCVHGEWGDAPDLIYGEVPPDEVLANSYLIAAAPDLLEALLAAREFGLDDFKPDEQEVYEKMDKAIAKAKGEVP